MKDWNTKKERYLQDDLPKRLGNLAVNLARIESLSNNSVNGDLVKSLVEESKFFIEWVATDIDLDKAADLIEFQIQLAKWQLTWAEVWANPTERRNVAKQAHNWSERLLDISGLISGAVS
ncbi:hypothetical protein [Synechocystis sp. PCC 7509]|uniref:hypothetical protein n=1 Tax=Synechocystis sp. PCC 7509 TaxID=927677 RepID=UPI0002AC72F4|nr:hypothetical protein [Synechocystis sp. PCC 7509]